MRRLAAVMLCLSVLAASPAAVSPASAFEVQSGGIPLSAAADSMLANRAGAAQPTASGAGGAFPPWMGGGRSEAVGAGLSGMKGVGLPPPGRPASLAGADRAAMNEQLFGIRR